MRLLCFGGRTYGDEAAIDAVLQTLRGQIELLIEGDAPGADRLCGKWAAKNGVPYVAMPALWDYWATQPGGRAQAGTRRNGHMIELLNPTHAVGFPGGAGSADMAAKCRWDKIPLWLPYGP